jgi:hypothetical protein
VLQTDASKINLLQSASNCSEQHGGGTAVSVFVLTSHTKARQREPAGL